MSKKEVLIDISKAEQPQNVQERGFNRHFKGGAMPQNVQERGFNRHFKGGAASKCPIDKKSRGSSRDFFLFNPGKFLHHFLIHWANNFLCNHTVFIENVAGWDCKRLVSRSGDSFFIHWNCKG